MLILVLRSAEVEPVDTSSAVRVVNGKPSVSIESLLGGSDSHTSRRPCYAVPASSSTSMKQDSSVQEPKKSIRGSGSGYGRARGKCPPPKKINRTHSFSNKNFERCTFRIAPLFSIINDIFSHLRIIFSLFIFSSLIPCHSIFK